jgi:phospholipid/cholesterol/gamma-HCH transport system substrate-binding protein
MDAEKRTEMIVGGVVAIGLLSLVLGLIWGKGLAAFEPKHELTARFSDVRGLEPGDPVMIRGLKKGEVEEITLHPDYVEVKLWVKKSVNLFVDLKVCVEDRELMGGKQITLYPGTVGPAANLEIVFDGAARSDMMLLMLKVERVLSRADSVFIEIHRLAKEVPVESMVSKLEATVESAAAAVEENRLNIKESLDRVNRFTRQLEDDSVAVQVGQLLPQLNHMAVSLQRSLDEMNDVAVQLQDSSGTTGQLMRDAALYNNMVHTLSRLDSLIIDVKRNPKKYLKVSVF